MQDFVHQQYPWIFQKQPRDPIKGRLRHDSLPMGRKLFFFLLKIWLIWLLNAHGWEVGCKLVSSDVFVLACFVEWQWGWAYWGWAVKTAVVFFKAYQLGSEIHRTTLCKSVVFFPWSLFDSSIIPLQLLNTKFKTWHPDSCFQIWYVRPRYSEFSQTQNPPPKKKQQRTPIFGCLAAWIRGSLKFPWKLATG